MKGEKKTDRGYVLVIAAGVRTDGGKVRSRIKLVASTKKNLGKKKLAFIWSKFN